MDEKSDANVFQTFSYEIQDRIAIFTFKGKALFNASGLYDMDNLAKSFRKCTDNKDLRVIIVKRSSEKKDRQEYHDFIEYASRETDKLKIHRMLNYYNQFILEMYSQEKFVISVDSENIVAQFLNLSMACDYRIVADNTVVQKAYFHNGMVPKGGAVFFLSQIVGKKKAFEILLSENDITAQNALEMGLVDEVVPRAELDDAAMKRAEYFADMPKHTLRGIKKLMNYQAKELEQYLTYENNVIANIFESLNMR
ncbi:MAG TPA: enoyl-CoA hydratase/isomerase family protein [bacterium]|nr:enoyl-CoA hydratase/isomerase family protein [bacterium]